MSSMWLIAEDEPDIYETFQALFELWGTNGIGFTSFDEAKAWIEDMDKNDIDSVMPELAILDIRLPDNQAGVMNIQGGIILSGMIRKSTRLKHIVVVLISAYHQIGNPIKKDKLTIADNGEIIITENGQKRALAQDEIMRLSESALLELSGADAFIPKPLPAPQEFKHMLDTLLA